MDWADLFWNACVGLLLGLPAWTLAAIALRVACHWSGLEIPAMGRALMIILVTLVPTALIGWMLQVLFVGGADHPVLQFLVFAITLLCHAAISASVYAQFLHAPFAQALTLWLVSTLLFLLGASCCACILGVPFYLLRREL